MPIWLSLALPLATTHDEYQCDLMHGEAILSVQRIEVAALVRG